VPRHSSATDTPQRLHCPLNPFMIHFIQQNRTRMDDQ
jgi:hypothetical protein